MHSLDLFPVAGLHADAEELDDPGTLVSIKPLIGDGTWLSSQPIRIEKCYTRWDKLRKRAWMSDKDMAEYWLDELVEITLFGFWEIE